MSDCRHNRGRHLVGHQIKAGDLLLFFECQDCGTNGWYQLEDSHIEWEEDDHECDETCARHISTCDGNCDHLDGENACVNLARMGQENISNCLLAYEGVEVHPDHGPCQMCNGSCPDKERLNARND